MSRATFPVRRPGEQARAILQERRVKALQSRVAALRAASSWWRRLRCALSGHRPWATGLAGQGGDGRIYALHVCERCGRRFAEAMP